MRLAPILCLALLATAAPVLANGPQADHHAHHPNAVAGALSLHDVLQHPRRATSIAIRPKRSPFSASSRG
jgi:hypothetical protein